MSSTVTKTDPASTVVPIIQPHVAGLVGGVLDKINVGQILAASGAIGSLKVANLQIGSAHVDQVTVQDTGLHLRSASAFLRSVRVVLVLDFHLSCKVDVTLFSFGGTAHLGSLSIPINVGDVDVPSLHDISLSIPSISASGLKLTVAPVTGLDLGSAAITGVQASNATLPAAGFQLTGLGISGVSINAVQVPATTIESVSVASVAPAAPIVLPALQAGPVVLPSASIPDVESTAPFGLVAQASDHDISGGVGPISVTLKVSPTAHVNIGSFQLKNVGLSANIGSVRLKNASIPVSLSGLNLGSVSLGEIDVKQIAF